MLPHTPLWGYYTPTPLARVLHPRAPGGGIIPPHPHAFIIKSSPSVGGVAATLGAGFYLKEGVRGCRPRQGAGAEPLQWVKGRRPLGVPAYRRKGEGNALAFPLSEYVRENPPVITFYTLRSQEKLSYADVSHLAAVDGIERSLLEREIPLVAVLLK